MIPQRYLIFDNAARDLIPSKRRVTHGHSGRDSEFLKSLARKASRPKPCSPSSRGEGRKILVISSSTSRPEFRDTSDVKILRDMRAARRDMIGRAGEQRGVLVLAWRNCS